MRIFLSTSLSAKFEAGVGGGNQIGMHLTDASGGKAEKQDGERGGHLKAASPGHLCGRISSPHS